MRRMLISIGLAGLLTLALAGTALGAHCVNESKQADAGQHVVVLLDPENSRAHRPSREPMPRAA